MNTKLTVLLATMCMSASVFAQTAPTTPTTPPNNGVNNALPNANAQLGQGQAAKAEHGATQNSSQMTRDQAKMTNAQRTKNVNCVNGGVATAPAETAAHAGKHDNQLAKADCVTPTIQR
jgi:hypothetical protein